MFIYLRFCFSLLLVLPAVLFLTTEADDPSSLRIFPTEMPTTIATEVKYVLTHPMAIQPSRTFAFYLILFQSDSYSLPVTFEATLSVNGQNVTSQLFIQDTCGLKSHLFTSLDVTVITKDPTAWLSVSVKFVSENIVEPSSIAMQSDEQLLQENFVFIQTDKAIYKPGQDVKVAVVVLSTELKPVSTGSISLQISDSLGNVMQALKNVSLANKYGIVEFAFTISAFTNLGDWAIEVTGSLNIPTTQKTFSVQFYVLPDVEVDLFFGNNGYLVYSLNEEMYWGAISAKYTFLKDAAGTANVTLLSTGGCNSDYDNNNASNALTYMVDVEQNCEDCDGIFFLNGGLNSVIQSGIEAYQQCSLLFQVIFTESVSNKMYTIKSSAQIYRYPYAIAPHPSNSQFVKPGLTYVARYLVTNPDGSPLKKPEGIAVVAETYLWTTEKPYDYRVDCSEPRNKNLSTRPDKRRLLFTDSNGMIKLTVRQFPSNFQSALFKMWLRSYSHVKLCDTHFPSKSKSGAAILLTLDQPVPSPLPKVGQTVTFEIKVTFSASWIYFILSVKGQAILYEYLDFPTSQTDGMTIFSTSVDITHDMAPRIDVVVWTIEMKTLEILADWQQFDVDGLVQQTVEASFNPTSVQPGGETRLSVTTTEPHAMLILLAVDKRVQLLKSGNQILLSDVLSAIAQGVSTTFYYQRKVGFAFADNFLCWGGVRPCWLRPGGADSVYNVFKNAQMAIFSNLDTGYRNFPILYFARKEAAITASSAPASTRKNFPETWIWLMAQTDAHGNFTEVLQAPDTITTYQLSVIAIGEERGFGATTSDVGLTIFKSFFVSLDVKTPSIKRYEEVQFEILLYNYQSVSISATLLLKKSFDFQVLVSSSVSNDNETFQFADFVETNIEMQPDSIASVPVWIRAVKVGSVILEITGHANETTTDAVEATIDVEAEGQVFFSNKAVLIQLGDHDSSSFTTTIPIAKLLLGHSEAPIVADSKVFQIQAIGSPIGSAIANLNQFVTLPSGCGEQTMVILAPDVYIYSYLKAVGALTTELDVTIKTYGQNGYNNELQYQRMDGGFSAFGNSDPHSSTWLTAFVVQVFTAAINILGTEVDTAVLNSAFIYISAQLQPDGSFKELGRIIHVDMQGGARGSINLAAYIYASIGEAGKSLSKSTRSFLVAAATDTSNRDSYQLALLSYAFSLNMYPDDQEVAKIVLTRLTSLASHLGTDMLYWKPNDTSTTVVTEYSRLGQSAIETAGYAVLAMIKQNQLNDAIKVARWLMTQRNSLGGFSSTQDTVIGLKALAALSSFLTSPGQNLTVEVLCNYNDEFLPKTLSKTFTIEKSNAVVLQLFDLPNDRQHLETVTINAKGVGVALVQIAAKYNLQRFDSGCFSMETVVVRGNIDTEITVKTCIMALYHESKGMVVLEMKAVTGMQMDLAATVTANKANGTANFTGPISRIELNTSSTIVFYFYDLSAAEPEICTFTVMTRHFPTKAIVPPMATTYTYYSPDKCFISKPIPTLY